MLTGHRVCFDHFATMPSELSLQAVKRLGSELLASRSHINNAPLLLSILSNSLNSPSSAATESLVEASLSLQAFFVPLLSSGELSPSVSRKAKESLQAKTGASDDQPGVGTPVDADAIYKSWLWDKYNEFLDILLQFISKAKSSPSLQTAGVDALMEFTRNEKQGEFSNRVYSKVCSTLVFSEVLNSNVLEHLSAKYFKYFDVCCYTCANLRKLAVKCQGQEQTGKTTILSDICTSEISLQALTCNIYDILAHLNSPKVSDKGSQNVMETWSKPKGGTHDRILDSSKKKDQQPEKAMDDKSPEEVKLTQKDARNLKSKITKAWLNFFRLPLSAATYEKVLAQLDKTVIPNLSNPILLSDFLTNSYNKGGVISVMALSGLFVLITQYGLEYPGFYNKLYALLEPSIFVAKYRARFFELLDVCLQSQLLPSYLAAAFAKKLGRMALTSPPGGVLIVIAIVHNLLRRHPSINCLVHQDAPGAEFQVPDSYKSNESAVNEGEGMQQAGKRLGLDPFLASEPDPAKCNALKSSLWEVEAIRRHYCPAVSRLVASLETDLTVRAKTMELEIKDFSSGSYATIFAAEVGKRMKQVPLAFYSSTPTMLFPKNWQSQSPGEADFPGWSFSCRQSDRNTGQDDNDRGGDVPLESGTSAVERNGMNKFDDAGKKNYVETERNKKKEIFLPHKKRKSH